MIALDVFLMLLVTSMGASIALYQTHTMIHRLKRNIERLEDQIHDLHMRPVEREISRLEDQIATAKPELRLVGTSPRPIVVESLGPPCDPPDSGEPYR